MRVHFNLASFQIRQLISRGFGGILFVGMLCLQVISACNSSSAPPSGQKNGRPNVVLIVGDDQGYGDIACNGNPYIKTPHMDALRGEGVSLTDFHTATTCAPTRAGIMTGDYCNKVGVWHTINGRDILKRGVPTIADVFGAAGYATGFFGKWHLGNSYPYLPEDRGFQEVLMHKGGGVGQLPDYWGNDYFDDTYFHNGKPEHFQGYCTDVWFANAMKFMERSNKAGKPFFCYLAPNAAHGPFHVPTRYSDLYKDNPEIRNPNFYGMITNIDDNLGRLRQQLEQWGIADNTILIYMSDNGTDESSVTVDQDGFVLKGYNAGMRGIKSWPYEGGHREPFFIYWKDGHITGGKSIAQLSAYIDILPTLADLCNISLPADHPVDVKSLKPLLTGEDTSALRDRIVFVDNQREEFLIKWKQACVMMQKWRYLVVDGKEQLYDIEKDPGQKDNILSAFPEVGAKLRAAYERWWDQVSVDGSTYNYTDIGGADARQAILFADASHMVDGVPSFNQQMVRSGHMARGFWAVDVVDSGKYTIELRRYPKESGLALNAAAPQGDILPSGRRAYGAGKALDIRKAFIRIDGIQQSKLVDPEALGVEFTVVLPAGECKLEARFVDDENRDFDAYYVYCKQKN